MTTTIKKAILSNTHASFVVGDKAVWVTPNGNKEIVTVTGRAFLGNTLIIRTLHGQQLRFSERNGRYVCVEYWGHLAKKPGILVAAPSKNSLWTRIKNRFH